MLCEHSLTKVSMGGLTSFLNPIDPITRKVDPIASKVGDKVADSGIDPLFKKTWKKEDSADQSSRPASTSEGGSLLEEKDAKKQLLGS